MWTTRIGDVKRKNLIKTFCCTVRTSKCGPVFRWHNHKQCERWASAEGGLREMGECTRWRGETAALIYGSYEYVWGQWTTMAESSVEIEIFFCFGLERDARFSISFISACNGIHNGTTRRWITAQRLKRTHTRARTRTRRAKSSLIR